MSKRKRKRRSLSGQRAPRQRPEPVDLQQTFNRADGLIAQGRAQEAVDLLEPLLPSHPRATELHYYLGYARVKAGDTWGGLVGYERAMDLSRDPGYWLPLASLYLDLGLNAHALHAFRQVLKRRPDVPMIDQVREAASSLEADVAQAARDWGIPVAQMEKGLRYLEEGLRALQGDDNPACIAASRRAIRLLGDFPPPRNNLSLALFFDGQPEAALDAARQVLSVDPENIQALSNAIRFLAWTGQAAEARALWARLQEITPQEYGEHSEPSERLKIAEAAAIMEEDEQVYQVLQPLDKPPLAQEGEPGFPLRAQAFLAVAEANTNRHRAARHRLKALQGRLPWVGDYLVDLEAGRPGPGWASRFPYFHTSDLMSRQSIEKFIELVSRGEKMPPERFRSQVARFVASFPHIILVAEKLIWEEKQPELGIGILTTIATPAAYAALRRFGLSQAGDDETRMQALFTLMEAGEIAPGETLQLWRDGEWREVQLRRFDVSDEPETLYTPEVADLLNQGLEAFQEDDHGRAERLFERALALDPRAREAYNNLGAIYARRGEHERAREMYQKALDIDPTYVFPRINLAIYLLDEDDVEAAEAMLAPLADLARLRPQEAALYSYVQARVLMYREEYQAARQALNAALKVWPGYEPAERLLDRLEAVISMKSGFESLVAWQRERDQARRARLQTALFSAEPSLSEALSIYTKGALTGVGRVVLPWGGWSALRKAELRREIVAGLSDQSNLARIVADLTDDERAALRQVLASGGSMSWQDFDAGYGNDLEESPSWEYHQPETLMGRLRLRGLLVEATVDGQLLLTVPTELRPILQEIPALGI